ncbi:MAG: hypothetical protein EAZ92_06085 [Candidatus Kapaibacterium sp.]|nr:MAG: hypothetical protein EAZ92_06085 [Candidatus Kapabacteria bacterium]
MIVFRIPLVFIFLMTLQSLIIPCAAQNLSQNLTQNALKNPFPPRFDRITSKHGLSSNSITCFVQDKRGFLWIGTHHGLNRFDGYRCKTFFANPAKPHALINDDIMDILEDRTGTLWVATHNSGVAAFQAATETFTHFRHNPADPRSLSDDNVHALTLDSTGCLWVCTYNGGLNRFDAETRTFACLKGKFRGGECGTNECSLTVVATARDGALWATSEGGGTYRITFPKPANSQQQFSLNSASIQAFAHASTSTINMTSNFTSALAPCAGSGVWSGSWGGGIAQIFPKDEGGIRRVVRSNESPNAAQKLSGNGLSHNTISALFCEADGTLWIGTWGGGLVRYKPNASPEHEEWSEEWTIFQHDETHPEPLGSNFITAIYRDRNGILWIGTENAGVSVWNPHKPQFTVLRSNSSVQNLPQNQQTSSLYLRDNMITALGGSSGAGVWIGTMNAGLQHFNPTSRIVTHFPSNLAKPNALSHRFIEALADDGKGTLWIGNDSGGVSMVQYAPTPDKIKAHKTFHPRSWRIKTTNPRQYLETPGLVEAILLDSVQTSLGEKQPQPALWLALTGTGLIRSAMFRDSATAFIPPAILRKNKTGPASTRIMAMVRDTDGAFWLATDTAGLDRFYPESSTVTHFRHRASDSTSLSSDQVSCLLKASNGALFAGTGLGLNRLDLPLPQGSDSGKIAQTQAFTRFTVEDGLPDNGINSMLEDAQGRLWIGTNKGLCRVSFPTPTTLQVRVFTEADGIAGNEHTRAAYRAPDGTMYFGTSSGLTIFHPDSIRENPNPTRLALTGLRKFNRPVQLDSSAAFMRVLPLSYLENIITVEFAALGFTVVENQQYSYKMDGFDRDWIAAGTSREATYTNLRGGEYLFRVRALQGDGSWSSEEARLTIAVTPPFWETAWFLTLLAVSVLGGVVALTSFVARQRLAVRVQELERERAIQQERERERERISADIHDEIGSGLTHIAILSEVIKQQTSEEMPARMHVDTLSETAQDVVKSIGNIVWALNPDHDELPHFLAYTREYSSTFLRSAGIRYAIRFSDEAPPYRLKSLIRRNLFLIVKESLNNIVKYADANNVEIIFSFPEETAPQTSNEAASKAIECKLIVRDDGCGMSSLEGRKFGHGMKTMRRRAEEIGGAFVLESELGKGTVITVTFALESA